VYRLLILLIILVAPTHSMSSTAKSAQNTTQAEEAEALKKKAQALKSEIISLNRDLERVEESLLYPPELKFGVFLALGSKTRFKLDSIELFVDDNLVSSHLYEERDLQSMRRGGIQQLYLGAVTPGKHKLTVSFKGRDKTGGFFKRKKAMRFDKSNDARYIRLDVTESPTSGEPVFKVKQW